MKNDQHRFLSLLGQLPARLTVEQAAWTLGCQSQDVPILVVSRLLKPLGNPARNGNKVFATSEVLELAKNRSWLAKVTNTVNQHWQKKNARTKTRSADVSQNGFSAKLNLSAAGSHLDFEDPGCCNIRSQK